MISRHDASAGRFPVPMTILVTDIEAFGQLRNPQQVAVRQRMYTIFSDAFRRAGVPWQSCAREDRGDGVLMLVPGAVSKAVVLARILPEMVAGLVAANLDGDTPP